MPTTTLGGNPSPRKRSAGFGKEFAASFPGECSKFDCLDVEFDEGDSIRADGEGGWICADCAEAIIEEESQ